jgi:hypothetical protein
MPAEAVHLSALADSFHAVDASLRRAVGFDDPERHQLLRLGAVMIDLPYFDRFALGVARYLLRRPLATSSMGDAFHRNRPVELGKRLLRRVAELRAHRASARDGERLLSVALGYFSHVAVDASMHPLVNQLAGVRAARLGDRPARQHNEVEKFHSVLFHEERLGYDFMGDARLVDYISVDAGTLLDEGVIAIALRDAIAGVHQSWLARRTLARWVRGYGQYVRLLASWFGGRIVPASVKEEVRGELYDAPYGRFVDHYARAVERSRRAVEAALAFAEDPTLDERFDVVVPEGSIDDPPYATDLDRGLA